MKKYALRFVNVEGAIYMTYDMKGNLSNLDLVEILPQLNEKQIEWIFSTLIADVRTLEKCLSINMRKIEIVDITVSITFEAFWKEYPNKVGRKERTRELWRLLTDIEKAKAFNNIKAYKKWISLQNNMAFVYPETYLSQRRWDNEFDEAVTKYYQ